MQKSGPFVIDLHEIELSTLLLRAVWRSIVFDSKVDSDVKEMVCPLMPNVPSLEHISK